MQASIFLEQLTPAQSYQNVPHMWPNFIDCIEIHGFLPFAYLRACKAAVIVIKRQGSKRQLWMSLEETYFFDHMPACSLRYFPEQLREA